MAGFRKLRLEPDTMTYRDVHLHVCAGALTSCQSVIGSQAVYSREGNALPRRTLLNASFQPLLNLLQVIIIDHGRWAAPHHVIKNASDSVRFSATKHEGVVCMKVQEARVDLMPHDSRSVYFSVPLELLVWICGQLISDRQWQYRRGYI